MAAVLSRVWGKGCFLLGLRPTHTHGPEKGFLFGFFSLVKINQGGFTVVVTSKTEVEVLVGFGY